MRRQTVAIVAAGVLVCFLRLAEPPVYDLNEAREGVYARAMLATGEFVLPRTPYHEENGVTVMDRPPLFHWIAAAERAVRSVLVTHALGTGSELSRAFDEWDLRFPSALGGVIMVSAVAVLGGTLVGRRAALLAAATLLAAGQFVYLSHLGRIDTCLASFVTLAMLLAGRAMVDGSRAALLGAAVASALAVLSKGPLGIVLPLVACTAFAGWKRVADPAPPKRTPLPWVSAALAWMALALPWYVAAWRVGGHAFIESNLFTENLEQFAGSNGRMSVFGYAIPWLVDTFPWNLLAVYGVWRALRTRARGPAFCALWWLSTLMVFEIAAYKRRAYLLPAVPAAALLAGWTLDAWMGREWGDATSRRAVRALVPVAMGTAVVGAMVGVLTTTRAFAFLVAGAPVDRVDGAFAGAGVVAAVGAAAIVVGCRRRAAAVAAVLVSAVALQIGAVPVWRIARAKAAAIPALVARIEREVPAGQTLTVLGLGNDPPLPLLFYAREPERWRVPPWPATTRLDPGWYLLSKDAWAAVSAGADGPADRGREVFRAPLRERGARIDVVLVRLYAARSVTTAVDDRPMR